MVGFEPSQRESEDGTAVESILRSATRVFSSEQHLHNILTGEWVELVDEEGHPLPGIRGRVGAAGMTLGQVELGADLIEMQPGSAFPLHTHEGDHLLYVVSGHGFVHIDGVDQPVTEGDTIFVPAEYPHGVLSDAEATDVFRLLAVGHPHKHVGARDRMHMVDPDHESARG
jgi:quercetin dioxygenase-like cupin family protein